MVWRRYLLVQDRLLVFATYNGPPDSSIDELADVEVMLATLRAKDEAT